MSKMMCSLVSRTIRAVGPLTPSQPCLDTNITGGGGVKNLLFSIEFEVYDYRRKCQLFLTQCSTI